MTSEEEAAAERLRKVMQARRRDGAKLMLSRVEDVGLLLCAVGRLDFLETTVEGWKDSPIPEFREAAKALLR